ncbi:MAG: glycoside hydrolase family 28 protein [Candidatus Marinimicrobia bacterium]|jgi:polygalacturonase|nr:glycoside hydrolase family 28 protein [Candidatus Neomarinimicrobiota bacterium]
MKKLNTANRYLHLNLVIFILLGLIFTCGTAQTSAVGWDQVPAILEKIVPPKFNNKDFDITKFGAIGNGKFDCTQAFVRAVEACHQAGGGRVIVPSGEFLTGAIQLKSNVNLHVTGEGVILFSKDTRKFLPVVYTRFEGMECMNYSPFIYAYEQENLAITGSGVIDGQADNETWWNWVVKKEYGWKEGLPNQEADRDLLLKMADDNIPVNERVFGDGHYLRPNFIQFYKCKNILIENVTLKRSPMWEIHPVLCENMTVRKVTIVSHGPNNDGCNPESCRNVLIKDCYFDTGDDCIAIKSGRNGDGRRIKVPSENIIIQGCRMKDGHGGVVIGSEMSGDVRNIFAENCIMDSPNLDRALRIKTNSLRGGVVENIYMRDVTVGVVSDAVVRIYFYYAEGDVGQYTPVVRNVYIENVSSKQSKYALLLEGYERSPIANVQLKNCRFDGVKKSSIIKNVRDLNMKDVYINGELQ